MSIIVRQLVELTVIKPMAFKCVFLHVADTVTDDLLFWRSKRNMARRLGTDEKVVRRHLESLCRAKLLTLEGTRRVAAGTVDVYRVNVDAILALPCIELDDNRADLVAKIGRGSQPSREGSTTARLEAESRTNKKEQSVTEDLQRRVCAEDGVVHSAKDTDPVDHLLDDPGFRAFVAEQEGEA